MPEETDGDWSKVWQKGEVDMRFWESYHPNKQSQQRFSWQFLWEMRWRPEHIPNWAWGHALDLGLLKKEEVPPHIPQDFDWPKLQSAWYQGKAHGGTALAVTKALGCPAGTSSGTPNAPAVESVTLAQGPKEDPESKNETGQDKDPEGHKEEDPNSKVEREEKQPEGCKEDPKPAQPESQQKKKKRNKMK